MSEVRSYLGLSGKITMDQGNVRSQCNKYANGSSYRMSDMYGMISQCGPTASSSNVALANYITKFSSADSQGGNALTNINWNSTSGNNGQAGFDANARVNENINNNQFAFLAWNAVGDVVGQSGDISGNWKFTNSSNSSSYQFSEELLGWSAGHYVGSVIYYHNRQFTGSGTTTGNATFTISLIGQYINFSNYAYAMGGTAQNRTLNCKMEYCNLKYLG